MRPRRRRRRTRPPRRPRRAARARAPDRGFDPTSAARRRLDAELVRRGLASSRERAQADIAAGRVTVGGAPAERPARLVDPGDAIVVAGPGPRFVSRGGEKLDHALAVFNIDVQGRRCVDAGASTGGFTDCLLQRGAASVIAVDVGYGQLHERVRADHRVVVRERVNVRNLDAGAIGGAVEVVVADLSFISLRTVADALLACAAPGADLVVLVKPQFEAGRAEAARGKGVIREPEVRLRVANAVATAFGDRGAAIMGVVASPITGADGNVELLLHMRKASS
ncbi:MAG: TlyA family RNA methyltransferase [Acidimicrobiales bacterium]